MQLFITKFLSQQAIFHVGPGAFSGACIGRYTSLTVYRWRKHEKRRTSILLMLNYRTYIRIFLTGNVIESALIAVFFGYLN